MSTSRVSKALIGRIQDLAKALERFPTEEERKTATTAIASLQLELGNYEARLRSHSGDAARAEAIRACRVIIDYLRLAGSEELLLPRTKVVRGAPRSKADSKLDSASAVQQLRSELDAMELDEIYSRLGDYRLVSLDMLRELATALAISDSSKLSRQDLVDKIAKRGFGNPRGYKMLRDGDEQRKQGSLQ